ncbi:MAG: copper chaperone PCu(A)C [Pseudomonadota bacterium]
MFRLTSLASMAILTLAAATASFADDGIMVEDAYARASTSMAKSGAAFMVIKNMGASDDRLVSASSPIAERVELHTHKEDANGMMKMMEVEEGFAIPAGGMHKLGRGGDHVMFLGLNTSLEQGDTVEVTLTFEQAGDMTMTIPVDLERMDGHGHGGHGHGHGHGHNHSNHNH